MYVKTKTWQKFTKNRKKIIEQYPSMNVGAKKSLKY